MSKESQDAKRETLQKFGTLHTAVEAVSDERFLSHTFFDPHDLVQLKYEMLRRVRIDGVSVSQAARDFGFSRTAFYQARSLLEQQGLPGLIPKRPGPKGAHKLSDMVLKFIQLQQQELDEVLRPEALAKIILDKFGFSVHPRSIERALSKGQKKRAIKDEANPAWFHVASADQWSTRYETVRQRALHEQHAVENGWEMALLVRRGVVAWMRAWPAVEESQRSHPDAHAKDFPAVEITIPSSLCEQVTSVLVNMILPQRLVELKSVH